MPAVAGVRNQRCAGGSGPATWPGGAAPGKPPPEDCWRGGSGHCPGCDCACPGAGRTVTDVGAVSSFGFATTFGFGLGFGLASAGCACFGSGSGSGGA